MPEQITIPLDPEGFGERLKNVIKRLGKTQKDFAEGMDMKPTSLSEILKGNHMPCYEFFYKIKEAYHVNLDYLLKGEGNPFTVPGFQLDSSDPFAKKIVRLLKAMELSDFIKLQILADLEKILLENTDEIRRIKKGLEELEKRTGGVPTDPGL